MGSESLNAAFATRSLSPSPMKREGNFVMARAPRVILPGQALHVVQRGNNRQACFFADGDYRYYLECLGDASRAYGCRIHAYVLMTNHVHLLMTPDSPDGPSRTLQSIGRRYVRRINKLHRRSGTLWEGRFRSTLIDSDRYLFACSRYIELNPVRAGMVGSPGNYRWSSYRANGLGRFDALLSPHPLYEQLGKTDELRYSAYRSLFSKTIDEQVLDAIRGSTRSGAVLGNDRFRGQIESVLQRRLARHAHGGDRKSIAFRSGDQSTTLTP
jgi:putative transposase